MFAMAARGRENLLGMRQWSVLYRLSLGECNNYGVSMNSVKKVRLINTSVSHSESLKVKRVSRGDWYWSEHRQMLWCSNQDSLNMTSLLFRHLWYLWDSPVVGNPAGFCDLLSSFEGNLPCFA